MNLRMPRLIPVLSVAALMVTATLGFGQNAAKLRPKADDGPEQGLKLSQVMKYNVVIQDDEPAGQVVDFIVSDGGCIDYLVATYDDQYYLIPYTAAAFRYDDSLVFVDLAPARFKQVQFFAADAWPDYYVPTYRQKVFTTFGVDARRGRATFRQDLDDDDSASDRREERRDRQDENRDRRRDRRDDRRDLDRDGARDLDRDRDRDIDEDRDVNRPPPPDRKPSTKKPAPKADPRAPKAEPKAPKAEPKAPKPATLPPAIPKKPAPKQP